MPVGFCQPRRHRRLIGRVYKIQGLLQKLGRLRFKLLVERRIGDKRKVSLRPTVGLVITRRLSIINSRNLPLSESLQMPD